MVDVHLSWSVIGDDEVSSPIKYFRVYRDNLFLGCTNSLVYIDKDLKVNDDGDDVEYSVRAIGYDGTTLSSNQLQINLDATDPWD